MARNRISRFSDLAHLLGLQPGAPQVPRPAPFDFFTPIPDSPIVCLSRTLLLALLDEHLAQLDAAEPITDAEAAEARASLRQRVEEVRRWAALQRDERIELPLEFVGPLIYPAARERSGLRETGEDARDQRGNRPNGRRKNRDRGGE